MDEASSAERRGRHRLEGIAGAVCALLFLCASLVLVAAFGVVAWLMRQLRPARQPANKDVPDAWPGCSLAALTRHLEAQDGQTEELSAARVLVAGGDPVNQQATVGMLERLGLRAHVSGDLRETLEMIRRRSYDLVLVDCRMTCGKGQETMVEIRKREPAGRHTTVVAMTAEKVGECLDHCLADGMHDVLLKPIRMVDLAAALHRWLPADRAGPVAENTGEVTCEELS